MRLLLDTHALLWFLAGDPALGDPARRAIEDPANERRVSVASLWEIAIKISLGKLDVQGGFDAVVAALPENDFDLLALEVRHVRRLVDLPFHHRDPFDRVLIAQAIEDDLTIVTADRSFIAYGVHRLR